MKSETRFALFVIASIVNCLLGVTAILFGGPHDHQSTWTIVFGTVWLVMLYLGIESMWETK